MCIQFYSEILKINLSLIYVKTGLTHELRMAEPEVAAVWCHIPSSSTAGHYDIISEFPEIVCQGNSLNIRV